MRLEGGREVGLRDSHARAAHRDGGLPVAAHRAAVLALVDTGNVSLGFTLPGEPCPIDGIRCSSLRLCPPLLIA
jgi:hypothetical protein